MDQQKIHLLSSLIQDFKQTDNNLAIQEVSKRVILLMGETKAGKTTLLYYLLGKELIWEKNQIDVWQMRPEAVYLNAIIGNGYQSTTVYPNIPPVQNQQQVMIIDMPGFDDSRPHFRLLNLYILHKTIKLIKNAHICLVIPEQSLNSKDIFRQLQKVYKLFNNKFLATKNNMSFIITKFENQDQGEIKQILNSGLQQILTQSLNEELLDAIKIIINNNIYCFANKQPIIAQGLDLKNQIIKDNRFFQVDDHNRLLSNDFQHVMIGETNLQQFQSYIKQILNIIGEIFPIVFYLVENVLKIQFLDIFSLLQDSKPQQMRIQLQRELQQLLDSCPHEPIKGLHYKFHTKKQLHHVKIINICKIFRIYQDELKEKYDEHNQQKDLQRYDVFLRSLSEILHLCRDGYAYIDSNFIISLEQNCKYFKTILQTILSSKVCSNQQILQKLIISPQIFKSIARLLQLWNESRHKIVQMPAFSAIAQDQEIIKYYFSRQSNQTVQIVEIKIKVPIMSTIRDIKTFQSLLSNCNQNIAINEQVQTASPIFNNINAILQMTNDHNTLNKLLQLLSVYKQQSLQLMTIKVILSKISNIFSQYSFYEQAIVFRIAFHDQNSVDILLKKGVDLQYLSLSFIKQILIPYYSKISPNVQKIIVCFGYINLITDMGDVYELQLQMIQILQNIKKKMELKNLKGKYIQKVQWHLICYIIEQRELVCKQVKKRKQLYDKSFIRQLWPYIFKKLNP